MNERTPYHAADMMPRTLALSAEKPKEPGYVQVMANQINYQREQLLIVADRLATLIDRVNGNPTGKSDGAIAHVSASIQETIRGNEENNDLIGNIRSRLSTLESIL